ncbi:hypothetical protein [Paenibacillus phytohabitans]|uniref:hypothetical protein n=1 Tax=Paenibacillus phytohabitans TaxID=2654978 RepID=UPI00300BCF2B
MKKRKRIDRKEKLFASVRSTNSNVDFLPDNYSDKIDLLRVGFDGHTFLDKGPHNICHAEMFGGYIFFQSVILLYEKLDGNLYLFFRLSQ